MESWTVHWRRCSCSSVGNEPWQHPFCLQGRCGTTLENKYSPHRHLHNQDIYRPLYHLVSSPWNDKEYWFHCSSSPPLSLDPTAWSWFYCAMVCLKRNKGYCKWPLPTSPSDRHNDCEQSPAYCALLQTVYYYHCAES